MSKNDKKVEDAFLGGMCAALSLVRMHGMDTCYEEIVDLMPRELERFAKENEDIELAAIRKAKRFTASVRKTKRGRADV